MNSILGSSLKKNKVIGGRKNREDYHEGRSGEGAKQDLPASSLGESGD